MPNRTNNAMYMLKRLLQIRWVLCLLLFPLPGRGYEVRDFTFSHVGPGAGLSSQRAFSLCETTDGAVWAATKNGVDRSNGVAVRSYFLADGEHSRFAGRVLKFAHASGAMERPCVFDNEGRIYQYNRIQDRFDLQASAAALLHAAVELNDVYAAGGTLWLATDRGVFWLRDGRLRPVFREPGVVAHHVLPLGGGRFFFCTDRGGYLYGPAGQCVRVLPDNALVAHYDARRDRLWVGTFNRGLVVARPSAAGPWAVAHAGPGIPHNPVRAIRPCGPMMLIGIDGCGVYQVAASAALAVGVAGASAAPAALTTAPRLLFSANDGPHGVLHGNGIYDILVDSWGNIIMASYSGGLDIARPVGSTVAIFSHMRNNAQSIIDGHVNCVMQYGAGLLVMGTEDGVSMFNTAQGTWRHAGRGLVVLDVCRSPDGRILAATYGNGVCEIGLDGQVRQAYSVAGGVLRDDHVYRMVYDREGNLWMGALYGPLAVKTAAGVRYFDLHSVFVMKLLADGSVAVGTTRGLFRVRLGDARPQELHYVPRGAAAANRYVTDLCEAPDGLLWIATDGCGVHIHDPRTGRTTQITTRQGLPSNSVGSIVRDNAGRFWLGTERGLAFVDPRRPGRVVNVSYCYGLDACYLRGSVARLSNGDILYGTTEAALIVNPKLLQKESYTARLQLTRVEVKGVEGRRKSAKDRELFNEQAAKGLARNEIWLKYSQRTFSVVFESINHRNHFDIVYQYRLGDNNWSDAFAQQYVNFENLEPGRHLLHIRCVSKTSHAVIDERTIAIHIAQPWWNTWWMWLAYLLLLAAAFRGMWWMYGLHGRYMKLVQDSANAHVPIHVAAPAPEGAGVKEEGAVEFINKATKAVLDHITDTGFTIDRLCREMGMSRTVFYMKLKTFTGKSPQDFVRVIRLERAAALLRCGKSVGEVSALAGFDNPKYFSSVFKKYFGVQPSRFNARPAGEAAGAGAGLGDEPATAAR